MKWFSTKIIVKTNGKGLVDFTYKINDFIQKEKINDGMCFLFIQHTSASLILSENWDPSAKYDLEEFMNRLVPENQSWFKHIYEGSDDSPSHMRTMLTRSSESIPIDNGGLNLGTWQGVYLFEHRSIPHSRTVLVKILA